MLDIQYVTQLSDIDKLNDLYVARESLLKRVMYFDAFTQERTLIQANILLNKSPIAILSNIKVIEQHRTDARYLAWINNLPSGLGLVYATKYLEVYKGNKNQNTFEIHRLKTKWVLK